MTFGTILVVQNLPEVRSATASDLEAAGYTVLHCGGEPEALAVLQGGEPVDLLLTEAAAADGIDGFELARQARSARPSMCIAYLAGMAPIPQLEAGRVLGPILQKPDAQYGLVRQVEALLAAAEDADLVRRVAVEMVQRHPDALDRAEDAAEIAAGQGDDVSRQAWQDIANAIRPLQDATRQHGCGSEGQDRN